MSSHRKYVVFLVLWPWNQVKVTKIKSVIRFIHIIYPWKFGKIPTTGLQDIMQTRECDADANRIRTRINMSPPPLDGDIRNSLSPYIYIYSYIIQFHFRYVRLCGLESPTEKWLSYLQTMETTIRGRILRRLILIYSLPINILGVSRLKWVKSSPHFERT